MNINHKYRTLFWHVPKTAGLSIGELPFVTLKSHYPVAVAVREQIPGTFETYFKFAFVRNPMDRFISIYHYFLQMGPGHRWWTKKNRKISEVVKACRTFSRFCRYFPQSKLLMRDLHFWPQHRWICDAEGVILMDFVGRFESLTEDINIVAQRKLGLLPFGLPHLNSTDHRPWQEYYRTKTRTRIVTDYYKRDFEIFDYPCLVRV